MLPAPVPCPLPPGDGDSLSPAENKGLRCEGSGCRLITSTGAQGSTAAPELLSCNERNIEQKGLARLHWEPVIREVWKETLSCTAMLGWSNGGRWGAASKVLCVVGGGGEPAGP